MVASYAGIDVDPPTGPTISSSSHAEGVWKRDNTIDLKIHPDATDTGGTGVAGYSITFSKDTTEIPPQVICTSDTPNATDTYTSPELADGMWYANVSTVDNADNWTTTGTVHAGPFKIDATPPVASLQINDGDLATKSSSVTLNISAEDNLSGLFWMRVRNVDGEWAGAWSGWEPFKTTKEWNLLEEAAATTFVSNGDGVKKVELEVKDKAYNHSDIVSDTIKLDVRKPFVKMITPFVSTKISKTTTFKVKWWSEDAAPSSGIKHYTVRYRRSGSKTWRTWKSNTELTYGYFTGQAGRTYYFRTKVVDEAGNYGWSRVSKTIVPFNEGIFLRKFGFFGYLKLGESQNYLSSIRYSYQRGHTMVYKLYNTNSIGLIVPKGPNMGRAKIYVDGKHVTTVDAYSSQHKARRLIFYKGFSKKGTHWLKVVNLGTPGRAKFAVDGVVVGR
jgi:hypothetical protein